MSPANVVATNFGFFQLCVAGLFIGLAYWRPQVAIEAKIYAACAVIFAAAKLPALGFMPPEVAHKWVITMNEWSNVAYISIALLHYVSRENLAFNAAGASLAMVAIIGVIDPYVVYMTNLFDFVSVAVLGLSIVAADQGKNPIAAKVLLAATAYYSVCQLEWPYKNTEEFKAMLSLTSIGFSLALFAVLHGRKDETPYVAAIR